MRVESLFADDAMVCKLFLTFLNMAISSVPCRFHVLAKNMLFSCRLKVCGFGRFGPDSFH